MDFDVLQNKFQGDITSPKFISKILRNLNIRLVTHKRFASQLIKLNKFDVLNQIVDIDHSIRIFNKNIIFNFIILYIDKYLLLFLVKKNHIKTNYHLFVENPSINIVFDKLFNYYLNNSISLKDYLIKEHLT